MSGLVTRFGSNSFGFRSDTPLTDEQLYRIAPSIFAAGKHQSRSDRYTYIPTSEVLSGLRKEGFQPFMVAQSKSRVEGKSEFTKHMLRLRPDGQIQNQEAYEIILINSHDGTSSYQMLGGVLRFVCQNGCVAGDIIEDIRVPHRGNITENVIDAAYKIVDDFGAVEESIDNMKGARLALPEARAFAEAALSLKYDSKDAAPILPEQLLTARRYEDRGKDDLWNAFNRIQENLVKGGLRGKTATGKRTTTREVMAIDTNIKLNRALWILSERMAGLKAGADDSQQVR
ncbi:MAG TPA: DUF932 domain-containing protein [Selenomonadales bacterium]|nr:DUF932 domain-containing protein [Selenomonadales bacterium]